MTLDSPKPGRFAFRAEARGSAVEALNLVADGTAEFAPQTGAVELRVARLDGALGPDRFRLNRPLAITRQGDDLALTGLAASFGRGRISGEAARRGNTLSLRLAAQDLPAATIGRLAGFPRASGAIGFDAAIDGPLAAPRGKFSLSGRSLRIAAARQEQLPALAVDLTGNWNGREIDLNGRVAGIKGETLGLSGSVPLAFDAQSLAIAIPPQGRLALRVHGAGEIANLADLLPLGEDQVAGRFRARRRGERHRCRACRKRAPDRDRRPLREFRDRRGAERYAARHCRRPRPARDTRVLGPRQREGKPRGARGRDIERVALSGGAPGAPTADIAITLKDFRVLGRDLAVVAASGTIRVTGPLAAPRVVARLQTDQGDVHVPASLPRDVARIEVVEVNGAAAGGRVAPRRARPRRRCPPRSTSRSACRGASSCAAAGSTANGAASSPLAGTSEAPQITGSLQALRGTVDVLGKTFRVTHGEIRFDGGNGAAIDPVLDIAAEVATADITAQVMLHGPVSAPKLTIDVEPRRAAGRDPGPRAVRPRARPDHGGRGAAGRGGGREPGRRRVRRARKGARRARARPARVRLGREQADGHHPETGIRQRQQDAALNAGKYVADGVYVGASQGLTPGSSKAVVEIEVLPRVTIQGDVSQSGSTGIGLNYKYDY